MSISLTITRPDDWHLHLRAGRAMQSVLPDTARRFGRAIVMPNLKPPVRTLEDALDYRQQIIAALPQGSTFKPLMTLYLTRDTTPNQIRAAAASDVVVAVKHYPAGATTNSDDGVVNILQFPAVLEALQETGLPLLVHGEVVDSQIDIFDRERVFIDTILEPLLVRYPRLKVVMEHITTAEAAEFVAAAGPNVAATITAHHLLLNRNAMLVGGIKPHHYCLPVLKRERHRLALVNAATSGSPKFFLGTDSAPHAQHLKEHACGCAGMYTAHAAIELYAEVFEAAHALDRLEAFASFHGADFYGLPRNTDTLTLVKQDWLVPETLPFGEHQLVPFRAGGVVHWRCVE